MTDSEDEVLSQPEAFVCSYCGIFAQQFWSKVLAQVNRSNAYNHLGRWRASTCVSCKKTTVWNGDVQIEPVGGSAPRAHTDMPENLRADFEEARSIADLSPRGAASLLRLCVQKLCVELGLPGKNLDQDIAALVARGLDERIQKALDIVRVIGNNAVHPGELDIAARLEDVRATFGLINEIIEELISKPRRLNRLYDSLPSGALESIEKRNARALTGRSGSNGNTPVNDGETT